jgi:erythromycin esterase-like protein
MTRAAPGTQRFRGRGHAGRLLAERPRGSTGAPETERISHYFHGRLADQFDAVIHLDGTHALEPRERSSERVAGELPETYPWGV